MINFWEKLNKPIFVLAPMADVTDASFRRIIAKYGKPDVMWTEFVSADGLALAPAEGKKILLKDLEYSEEERPIVAQLFSGIPERMKIAAKIVQDLGFDGLDINMGCPDRSIEKQCAGAALIKDPKLAREIIKAAKEGAPDLPISVKTRLGFNKDELETWLPELLAEDPAVIILHLRTRKEMSKVSAHWERMKDAIKIRDDLNSKTLIFGNGDVYNLEEAKQKVIETGCDGIMIGRGIFGNPWCFNKDIDINKDISLEEKLKVIIEHTKLYEELLPHKSFHIMKKHYKSYLNGLDGVKELKTELMDANNAGDIEHIVKRFLG